MLAQILHSCILQFYISPLLIRIMPVTLVNILSFSNWNVFVCVTMLQWKMHASYALHSVKSCAVAMMAFCGTCFTLCWAEILYLPPRPMYSLILGIILFVARLMKKKFDLWSCDFQCGIVVNARGLPWKCCINMLQSVADLRDICMLLCHCYVSFS